MSQVTHPTHQQPASQPPSSQQEFRALLDAFRTKLEGELGRFFREREEETRGRAPQALELLASVEDLVQAGGKRLRPALVYFSYRACGGEQEAEVLPLAMGTELLHTYLLIHDDIMDRAPTRRGKITAHRRFEAAFPHTERGPGRPDPEEEARHHGTSMAILSGDLASTLAFQLFASLPAEPAARRLAVERLVFLMSREVIDGQFLEMHAGLGADPSGEDLARILQLKSGLYSVERPVELGATLAEADPALLGALKQYGRALGEAFQLQDDLLGVFADETAVGKPVGGDLEEGKHTFLIHHALRLASPDDESYLRSILGRAGLTHSEVQRGRSILESCGARAAVEAMIEERSETARRLLEPLQLAPSGHAFLRGLVDYLEQRSH
ncbi:MAG: polyprenyl synthetase family protein [Acidobacteriota bacterium]